MVVDPVRVDPDPTFKKKLDPDPDTVVKKRPEPDPT